MRPAEVAVQRQAGAFGGGVGDGHRHTQDRIGTELGLVLRAVQLDHQPVDVFLVACVQAQQLGGELVVDVVHGLLDALALIVVLLAVTQFDGLVLAGARAGGDDGPPDGAVGKVCLDFNGRIAARIQDLPAVDDLDFKAHGVSRGWVLVVGYQAGACQAPMLETAGVRV